MLAPHRAIVVFALLAVGCGARAMGPPEIVADRTACSHCRMFVSDLVYAAAYQVPGADARVFDDIGCLLTAIDQETASPATVWVQDAGGTGWLEANRATFVSSPHLRTPMNGGVLAYADRTTAESAAATQGGQAMSWQELRARGGVR